MAAWPPPGNLPARTPINRPPLTHVWWVTKRLLKRVNPEGWPPANPLWRSTLSSYWVLWACHMHLTPRYRALMDETAPVKRVERLTSPGAIRRFLSTVAREQISP